MSENGDEVTNAQLLREIINNRNEFKACETRLLYKIEENNKEIKNLKEENNYLKSKVEQLEKISKKKNILVFGLELGNEEEIVEYTVNTLSQLLQININSTNDISNLYQVTTQHTKFIKIEFVSQFIKDKILKNGFKLKNTKLRIVNDLTYKEREDYKILKTYLNEVKTDPNNVCYIRKNQLIVNNVTYTAEELKETGLQEEENLSKSNSAPHTPSTKQRINQETLIQEENIPTKQIETEIHTDTNNINIAAAHSSKFEKGPKIFNKNLLSSIKNQNKLYRTRSNSNSNK